MDTKTREASALLHKYQIRFIKPGQLSKAATQLGKSISDTLKTIAFLKSGGSGYGPFPYTSKTLKKEYS